MRSTCALRSALAADRPANPAPMMTMRGRDPEDTARCMDALLAMGAKYRHRAHSDGNADWLWSAHPGGYDDVTRSHFVPPSSFASPREQARQPPANGDGPAR